MQDITFEVIRSGRPSHLGGKSEDLSGFSGSSIDVKAQVFDQAYLERLRRGDDETAKHFDRYFRRVVRAKVWGKFSRQVEEDLIDDVMAAAIENVMQGQPRDASYLPGYICGICLNLMRQAMRPGRPGSP